MTKQRSIKAIIFLGLLAIVSAAGYGQSVKEQVRQTLRPYIKQEAVWALKQKPITVTAQTCSRSAGNKHEFYSEGDYWWPNPKSDDSAYVQHDGMTNPQNFVAHRLAMIRFSKVVGALATAYKVTGEEKYVKHAVVHLKAWFVDTATMMNPNMLYAQAIKGVATGRGIGIIDAIQLMDVVQGAEAMRKSKAFDHKTYKAVQDWFAAYLQWVTTHKYGKDEMNAKNNHGTCWVMQVACFSKFTGNTTLMDFCRDRYKQVLLPNQMATDGSFPLELKRTKPYGYSIFDLDALCAICQLLSTPTDNLWKFETSDGRSIKKGVAFLWPYLKDKNTWPYQHDVMYWEDWPVAQPLLVFGAAAFGNAAWLKTWKVLDHAPQNEEIIRNLPVRHPLLWLN